MAKATGGISGGDFVSSPPKKTRQGRGKHTKYAASSRNSPRKKYKGQGRYNRVSLRGTFFYEEIGINR